MSKQTDFDIGYVARLARLELSGDEPKQFGKQLGDILEYIDKLNELDTANIEPTAHAIDVSNVMRPDEVTEFDNRKQALENAPEEEDGLFQVPPVIE